MKLEIRKEVITKGSQSEYTSYLKHNPKIQEIYVVSSSIEYTDVDFEHRWFWFDKVIHTKETRNVDYATFDKLKDAEEYVKIMSKRN